MRTCSFDGCDKKHTAKGLCATHYMQAYNGRVLKPLRPRVASGASFEDKFESYLDKSGDCWLWTGSIRGGGYGRVYVSQTESMPAHRAAYQLWVGQLSDSSVVHHTCHERRCCNPAHLQQVTPAMNTAEMLERGSYLKQIEELTELLSSSTEELESLKQEQMELEAELERSSQAS